MEKLHTIELEIAELYSKVMGCEDLKAAFIYIDRLIKINEILCKMIFIEKIKISDKLWSFFKDFDISYDNQMHEFFFKKIKSGEYKQ